MENEELIKDIPKRLQQAALNSARKYRAPTSEIHLTASTLDEEDITELERNEHFYSQMVTYNREAVMRKITNVSFLPVRERIFIDRGKFSFKI